MTTPTEIARSDVQKKKKITELHFYVWPVAQADTCSKHWQITSMAILMEFFSVYSAVVFLRKVNAFPQSISRHLNYMFLMLRAWLIPLTLCCWWKEDTVVSSGKEETITQCRKRKVGLIITAQWMLGSQRWHEVRVDWRFLGQLPQTWGLTKK